MTNGEKLRFDFPNATTRICKNTDFTYIEMEQNDKWIADFDIEWWNTPYKERDDEDIHVCIRWGEIDLGLQREMK